MSQRPDDFYADLGQLGASDDLRPVYERLDADARAWSVTVDDEARLIAFARALPRRSHEETMRMQSQPNRPEWEATQRLPHANPDNVSQGRPSRLRTWVAVVATTLVVALLGGSFYLLQATRHNGTPATPTATTFLPTATETPLPTATAMPLPVASASQLAACGITGAKAVMLGDLLVVEPTLTNLAYPSHKLPDGTPLAPLKFLTAASPAFQSSNDPAINPNLTAGGGGYQLFVCNSSSTHSHIVNSVSARIDGAIGYTGTLSAWNLCDGLYNAETKQNEAAGCGGGNCASETLNATFAPSALAGATVTTTQLSSDKDIAGGCGGAIIGPLPVTLKPLHSVSINVGITPPTKPATYAWAFGISQDSRQPIFVPVSRLALLAPVTHKWSGAGCLRPEMQSQIPSGSTDAYICPES